MKPSTKPSDRNEQNLLDSGNIQQIEKIIARYGYPGNSIVGIDLSDVAFIVIQHASLEKQEKYFPVIEQAVKKRELDKNNLPYMVDRIRMRKDLPQLYGTQVIWNNKKAKFELYPVEDIKNVDKRRYKFNLPDLKYYLKEYNIKVE